MLKTGILNPAINSLLCRVRHTNTLVIADRGFPFFRDIEIIDISLVDDIPRVLEVLTAIRSNFVISCAFMAQEFQAANTEATRVRFDNAVGETRITFEAHVELKKRVPQSVGVIRTGDTTQYANIILRSA